MSVTFATKGGSPRSLSGSTLVVGALTLGLLALVAGAPLSGGIATAVACLALLVFGLPHGTLDLAIIRAQQAGPWTGMVTLVLLYLGLAAAMYGLWRTGPVLALGAFIAIAVAHFSEDWDGAGPVMLRAGLALALLAAPTLLHRAELDAIFIGLTDREGASAVTDGLMLILPVAVGLGLISIASLWQAGRRDQAIGGLTALTGMLLLPPIIGFALYFCLFHSPRHFRESLLTLKWRGVATWGWVVVPLTLAAGVIAVLVFGSEVRTALPERIMAASFMTLSILTVPHMLVPPFIAALSRLQHSQTLETETA